MSRPTEPSLNEKSLGSSFDDFLAEEGLLEAAEAVAAKRVLASQPKLASRGALGCFEKHPEPGASSAGTFQVVMDESEKENATCRST